MKARVPARINLKHLHYFHEVAREGSLTAAARRLHLAPQTLSSQVRELERSLGRTLLERTGRRLVLTPDGEVARDYAESIFALGTELRRVMAGRAEPRRLGLRLGVTDSVPKLLTARVLAPLLERHRDRLELDCVEGTSAGLLGRLAAHQLDAVLADQPVPPYLARSMRGRQLLKSGLSFVAAPHVCLTLSGDFPACLEGAPLIAGSADSPLSIAIDAWLAERGVTPRVVAHCDDSALIKVFAQRGFGIACVPTVIESDVATQFGLQRVGRVPKLTELLYLIRPAGRQAHPLLDEIESGIAGGAAP
jgi:LysR family transcriptional regulator, transcriptional activator of nhaA